MRSKSAVAGPRQRAKLQRAGQWFEVVVISGEMGVAKPSSEIFTTVLSALGTRPSGTVIVGDNPINDVHGARSIGVRGVLLRRPDGAPFQTAEPPADLCIRTLEERPALLGINA